jgi:hypothetical protein
MTASSTLAGDLAMALDPVVLARAAGIEPDPWQADVLRSSSKEILLNCSRQAGKSTITAVLAVHEALFKAGALLLIFSPTLRQSKELFLKVKAIFHIITGLTGYWKERETGQELTLPNGSRIVALPGNKEANIRGFSGTTLLLIDEAARVLDELYSALRPMLAVSQGRMVIMSTPWGRRGFFHSTWTEGGPEWMRVEIPATQVPRIPAEFLEKERRSLPPLIFQQEYMCGFAEKSGAVFTFDEVDNALVEDMPAFFLD